MEVDVIVIGTGFGASVAVTKILEKVLYKEIINEALISLVVVRNLLFSVVEWLEFHTFYKVFNP